MADWPRRHFEGRVERVQPWERQPHETDSQWEHFLTYRELGPGRSLAAVADALGLSMSHCQTLSSRYSWRRRTEAYEAHLDTIRQQEHEAVVRDMARKHALASQFMIGRAIEKMRSIPLEEMTLKEAIMMFKAAVPVQRQAQEADLMWRPPALRPAPLDDDDAEDGA